MVILAAGVQIGERVEALPFGTQWQACVVVSESRADGGYGVRCDSGAEFFVGYRNVRAAPSAAAPPQGQRHAAPPRRPPPAAGGSTLTAGAKVEALPFGTQWQACVVTGNDRAARLVGVRCDYGVDYAVAAEKVRAPTGVSAKPAYPAAPAAAPTAAVTAGALPIGKTLKCYYLAGATLNYSYVDLTFTSGSQYKDRRGATGVYSRSGSDIRFTSGPLAAHRAQVKPGAVALFAPNASFGMSCS